MLANISQQYTGSSSRLGTTPEPWKRMVSVLFISSRQYIFSYVKTTTKSKDSRKDKKKKNSHAGKRLICFSSVDPPAAPLQGSLGAAAANWAPLGAWDLFTEIAKGKAGYAGHAGHADLPD